jgi:polysaccharide export outer membrane protein
MTSIVRPRALALLTSILLFVGSAPAQEPAAEVYQVGSGDILMVVIHPGGESNVIETEITVAGDGTIDVVHAGRIKVAGRGTSEIRVEIRKGLIRSGVYLQPQVSVNVKEYLSQGVNVAGAVNKQGRYYLKGPTRVLDILAMADGIDDEKSGNYIVIAREGMVAPMRISRRDLFSADVERAQAANVRVQAGDNVNVPLKAKFCIGGAVKDPGCYTLEENASLHQVISMGGGLLPETVDRKNIVIRRASGTGELKVDLDAIESGSAVVPLIEPDDVVTIGSREKTRFCVDGQVEKPDCHEYEKGLTLDGAISKAGGVKIDVANTKDVKVRRIVGGKLQVFSLSLDDTTESGSRFRIEPDDQIIVPKADCLVTVSGCVKTPDQYPLTTGMTITDAISKAGGTHADDCWGKLSNVQLRRGSGAPQTVNVKAIQEGAQEDIMLQCGDKILVKSKAL